MSNDQPAAGMAPARFPRQGLPDMAPRTERVLLLCFYDPAGISTVPETVAYMQSASSHPVTVLNMFEHRADPAGFLRLHERVDLRAFSAVVIHNSVSYNVDNLRSLDQGLGCSLREFPGAKILLKQDENHRFRELAAYIGDTGFDVVFTCLPSEAVPQVYPREVVGAHVRFERMLTGYVTPTLRQRDPLAGPRPIDIGYRGSIQPVSFGWLAYEKRKIGDDTLRALAGCGLRLDISSRWEDRIGGDAWFRFLASCKATLGAESGASIFDLDGDLEKRISALEVASSGIEGERERTEAILRGLGSLEGNVYYNQVSPRHFEAAACGAVQVLYPGSYSGLMVAGRHYVQLERDCSNLDDVVSFICDEPRRAEMARRAFDEVVMNPANWIESFVARLDDAISTTLEHKGLARLPERVFGRPGRQVLLIAAHDPVVDPRLAWIEEGAPEGMAVHQLGVLYPGRTVPRQDRTVRGNMVEAHERQRWRSRTGQWALASVADHPAGMAGAQELLFLESALRLDDAAFCELFGAPLPSARLPHFRTYLQYLLDTSESLLPRAVQMRGVNAIIATDLDTLPAALVLKAVLGVPVLYDAHEYWPEADVDACEAEKQFWVSMERRMVAHVDACQTVSPGLADLMASQYGVPFDVVPNCEPLDRLLPDRGANILAHDDVQAHERCVFLFQGNFAPGRGIDLMIQTWSETDPRAVLHLRGPDGPYKARMLELARATGLLGTRIEFPEPVSETELIRAAAAADVGVIPYTPAGMNYTYCCPNKTSQYMAAAIPILANRTSFVSELVSRSGAGAVCDFARASQLVEAVRSLCDAGPRRKDMGLSGREFFASAFNWNAVSRGMYGCLERLMQGRSDGQLLLYTPVDWPHLLRRDVEPVAGPPAPAMAVDAPTAALSMPGRWQRLHLSAVLLWSCVPEPVRIVLRPLVNGVVRPVMRLAHAAFRRRRQRRRAT